MPVNHLQSVTSSTKPKDTSELPARKRPSPSTSTQETKKQKLPKHIKPASKITPKPTTTVKYQNVTTATPPITPSSSDLSTDIVTSPKPITVAQNQDSLPIIPTPSLSNSSKAASPTNDSASITISTNVSSGTSSSTEVSLLTPSTTSTNTSPDDPAEYAIHCHEGVELDDDDIIVDVDHSSASTHSDPVISPCPSTLSSAQDIEVAQSKKVKKEKLESTKTL
jgi:hypothetical protein